MSIASVAAQQSSATTASTAAGGGSSGNALTALSGNFQNFLQMLMTQLKNQDPTSPLDTNQFTTELVQFSSVEQQISTNSNLTQLIQLTQGDTVVQSSSLLGKPVAVQSSSMPLQNGTGAVQFSGTAGQQVEVDISNSSGTILKTGQMTAVQGANTWNWDGTDNAGNSLPDGAYSVAVVGAGGASAGTAVPFSVVGTATAVQVQNNVVQVQLGGVTVPFSAVQSVGASVGAKATGS
jgi:flagellar basal-body rod modification protein FlgD